jgi:hypothetical protein
MGLEGNFPGGGPNTNPQITSQQNIYIPGIKSN